MSSKIFPDWFFDGIKYLTFVFINKVKRKKIVTFSVPQLGHVTYIKPIIDNLKSTRNNFVIALIIKERTLLTHKLRLLKLLDVDDAEVTILPGWYNIELPWIDLHIDTDQFSNSVKNAYSVCIFHGQPSKGITFDRRVINDYDELFLYGPLHLKAFNKFWERHLSDFRNKPKINHIGYPKMDQLLMNDYLRKDVLESLKFTKDQKTIIYAPAFNEYASLRVCGKKIIESLKSIKNVNIIIKLAAHSIEGNGFWSNGGVDWKKELGQYEDNSTRIADGVDINPYLSVSNVMITDVSGVAYDFLALNKPVIYYDCPDFYKEVSCSFDGSITYDECINDDTINAGRNYGLVVSDIAELKEAVIRALNYPEEYTSKQAGIKEFTLYNPANATTFASNAIRNILRKNAKSSRYTENLLFPSVFKALLGKIMRLSC